MEPLDPSGWSFRCNHCEAQRDARLLNNANVSSGEQYFDLVCTARGSILLSMERKVEQCWASSLGGCSQILSREHLVSAGLFTDLVDVHGFPWCKTEWKRIGLSSLTAKILCEKHNNALSPVDEVGQSAFRTLQEHARISQVRRNISRRRWSVKRHEIDGNEFQRWTLKTLINLCSESPFPIGMGSKTPGRPSEQLVRIAYGQETFIERAGLYIISRKGMMINQEDVVSFAPLIVADSTILGGTFTFRGFRFRLYLDPKGPSDSLQGIEVEGEALDQCELSLHPDAIVEYWPIGNKSQVVTFAWNHCKNT